MKRIRWALAGTCLIALVACGDKPAAAGAGKAAPGVAPASARVANPPMLPAVRVQLDSGNAAYRAKDYAVAEAHYRAAARVDSGSAAAWFGVAMAAEARGDTASASAARKRIQVLAPALSLKHPAK